MEYSPLPGTVRSYDEREEFEEPCTRNKTGRGGSPGIGARARFRQRLSFTSPFRAQYSALHISVFVAACIGPARPARNPAPAASPAFLRTVRRGNVGSVLLIAASRWAANSFGRRPYFGQTSRLTKRRAVHSPSGASSARGRSRRAWARGAQGYKAGANRRNDG